MTSPSARYSPFNKDKIERKMDSQTFGTARTLLMTSLWKAGSLKADQNGRASRGGIPDVQQDAGTLWVQATASCRNATSLTWRAGSCT